MNFNYLTPHGGVPDIKLNQPLKINFDVVGSIGETDNTFWFFDDPYANEIDNNPNVLSCLSSIKQYHIYSRAGIYHPKLLVFNNNNNYEIVKKLFVGENKVVCQNKPTGFLDKAFIPKLISFYNDEEIRYTVDGTEPVKSSNLYVPEGYINYNNDNTIKEIDVRPTEIFTDRGRIEFRFSGFNENSDIPFYTDGFGINFDTTKPIISWVSTPPKNNTLIGSTFSIRSNKTVNKLFYKLNNGDQTVLNTTTSFTVAGIQNSSNTIEIWIEDFSGYISNKINYNWNITNG